jgi:phosphatidylinositol alpha-1,6-mannosyltransferase
MTARRLSAVLVATRFPPDIGGVQTWCQEVAQRLARLCDGFAVLAPRQAGAAAVDAALPYTVVRAWTPGDGFALSGVPALSSLLRRQQPDVVLASHWSGAFAARRAGASVVVSAVHGREVQWRPLAALPPAQAVYDAVRRQGLADADRLVAVSEFTAAQLIAAGISRDRITVVTNGVDAATFEGGDGAALRRRLGLDRRKVLLTVCRIVPRKGIDVVLEALPRILAAHPDTVYLVCGEGPDRPRLEAIAGRLGVESAVRFLGRVEHASLPSFYAACDVFVMPARSEPGDCEGFGLTYLEAGAAGKPVVGSTEGGAAEAVIPGVTGMLVDPRSSDAVAGAVVAVLDSPEMAMRLGEAGHALASNAGSWDATVAKLLDVMAAAVQDERLSG